MNVDEVIWQIINQGHCSFKAKTNTQNFCRNEYNITGLCNRSSCPLANSRYATILEKNGILYLYMKTAERAHTPKDLWERVKLSKNYEKALEQIDQHLIYWPKFIVHKSKQRLTKLTQMLIRMRRLALKVRPKLVGIRPKEEKRERAKERKALGVAEIEKAISTELLSRLAKGVYGDEEIVSSNHQGFLRALKNIGAVDDEAEVDEDEDEEGKTDAVSEISEGALREMEDEEDHEDVGRVDFVEDFSEDDASDMEDFEMPALGKRRDREESDEEEAGPSRKKPKKPSKKGGRKEIEHEHVGAAKLREAVPDW